MTYKARFTAYQRTNGTATDAGLGRTWALTPAQARRLGQKSKQAHGDRLVASK